MTYAATAVMPPTINSRHPFKRRVDHDSETDAGSRSLRHMSLQEAGTQALAQPLGQAPPREAHAIVPQRRWKPTRLTGVNTDRGARRRECRRVMVRLTRAAAGARRNASRWTVALNPACQR